VGWFEGAQKRNTLNMEYEKKPAVSTNKTGFSGINFGIDDWNSNSELGCSCRTLADE